MVSRRRLPSLKHDHDEKNPPSFFDKEQELAIAALLASGAIFGAIGAVVARRVVHPRPES